MKQYNIEQSIGKKIIVECRTVAWFRHIGTRIIQKHFPLIKAIHSDDWYERMFRNDNCCFILADGMACSLRLAKELEEEKGYILLSVENFISGLELEMQLEEIEKELKL